MEQCQQGSPARTAPPITARWVQRWKAAKKGGAATRAYWRARRQERGQPVAERAETFAPVSLWSPARVPLIPPTIKTPESTARSAPRSRVEPEKTPFDPAKTPSVLRAVLYRDHDAGLDTGTISENLKRAACKVLGRSLTVGDVEALYTLQRGVEAHWAKMQASRSRVPRVPQPPRRACARRPVSPPEVLMRRRPDTQTPSLLAVLDEAPPANYPVTSGFSAPPLDSPAGSVQPPPPHEVKPPLDFRARVEQRRAELAAGGKPLWLDE